MRQLALVLTLLVTCLMVARTENEDRVATARSRVEPILREKFRAAGVAYPAHEIFVRVFKREAVAELWARGSAKEPFRLVHRYVVTCSSGRPGPKRMEGDCQVPEGFYEIDRFNPKSMFHLSLGLNYPNAADRILSDAQRPGFDIFLHGSNVSVGCVPVGDEAIEELYVAAFDSHARPPQVHIFPAKMNAPDWAAWRDEQVAANAALAPFWQQLQRGFDAFEEAHRLPVLRVAKDGSYQLQASR